MSTTLSSMSKTLSSINPYSGQHITCSGGHYLTGEVDDDDDSDSDDDDNDDSDDRDVVSSVSLSYRL